MVRTHEMTSWNAHLVQVAWFLMDTQDVDGSEVFTRIWGAQPDQVQRNRTPNPMNPFLNVASTQTAEKNLQVQVQPGRIDLLTTSGPMDDEHPYGRQLAAHEELENLIDAFESKAVVFPNVIRLSMVVHLLKPVTSYKDGASEFYRSVGYNPRIEGATDLLFQLNSPADLNGTPVNRIVHFSVAALQSIAVQFAVTGATAVPQIKARFAAFRQFDFNTVPDGRRFEEDKQIPTLKALRDEVTRVMDTPGLAGLKTEGG